ncbi:oligosaccharide flippase family protein [Micromonospora sp. NPDC050417]|uniref:oligosaccharide flippase family protein n=1 Tax=Micromonospora sp. NPDC050417 TaxID=3364280 RepID=UPI0037887404
MKGTVAWTSVGLASSQLSRIVVALVLARILGPTEFAPVAAGAVFMTFVALSVDLGLVSAIIQRPVLTPRHLRVAALMSWTCGSVFGVGTLIVCLAGGAGPVGSTNMLFFSSLAAAPLIRSIGLVSQSRLYRDQRQHLIGKAETGVAVLVLVCCGGAILAGLEAFAYVVPVLAAELALAALWIGMSRPFPWPGWDREGFRELWSFSSKSFGSDAVSVTSRNIDSIIVGWIAGAGQLSIYSVGVRFLVTPVQFLGEVIVRIALPEFSEKHRIGESIGPVLLARTKSLSIAIWPTMTAVFFVAPWIVPVVLGPEWTSAVAVTQVLCLVGAAQVSLGFIRPAMWSVGAVKPYLLLTLVVFVVSVGIYLGFASYGAVGVAAGYAFSTVALAPALAVVGSKALGLPPLRTLRAVFSGAPAAILVAAPVLLLGFVIQGSAHAELVEAIVAVVLLALFLAVGYKAGLLVPKVTSTASTPEPDGHGAVPEQSSMGQSASGGGLLDVTAELPRVAGIASAPTAQYPIYGAPAQSKRPGGSSRTDGRGGVF